MKTEADHRKKLIERQLTLDLKGKKSPSIQPWQTLASHLTSIVGEEGFLVLYSRSLHLLRAAFPKLPNGDSSPSSKAWLADLENALSKQDQTEANIANHQLLMTFTNILSSLIGEDLTIDILLSAWGEPAANRNPASKEIDNEK